MSYVKDYSPRVPAKSFMPQNYHIEETFKVLSFPLTAAQLESMHTTAITIFPAPPTGQAIIPVYFAFIMYAGSAAFTGGGTVNLQYHTNTSIAPFASTVPASVVTEATPGTYLYYLDPTANFAPPLADGIDITNGSAVFAAGNGTAKCIMAYRVITT
jgi:hypothetical protein